MSMKRKVLATVSAAVTVVAIMTLLGDEEPVRPEDARQAPVERARGTSRPGTLPAQRALDRRTIEPVRHAASDPGRAAELAARGFTPQKLYGSRNGGRLTLLAIQARSLGDTALADETEALGMQMWASTDPTATGAFDKLLATQASLVRRFQDLARRHPDDPFLIVLVGQVHEDLVAAMTGEPRGIDRKLETEDSEGDRHSVTDHDDEKDQVDDRNDQDKRDDRSKQ